MADCVFCAIVAGEMPATIVDEDDDTVAFMDINPWTRGHTLVVPRRHQENYSRWIGKIWSARSRWRSA